MLKILLPGVLISVLAVGTAWANPTQKLLGMSEENILMCAGIPDAKMKTKKLTFLQYDLVKSNGVLSRAGRYLVFSDIKKGCRAILTLKGGIVVKVGLRKRGIISGPLACNRIFSGC